MSKKVVLYRLCVSYSAEHYFDNNLDLDSLLEEAVGQYSSGSGCGLGGRDLDWAWQTAKSRDAAKKKVEALKLPSGVSIHINTQDSEYDPDDWAPNLENYPR